MKKLLFVTVFVFCCFFLKGQKIEVFEGINTTFFYESYRYSKDPEMIYDQRLGQEVGICISDLWQDKFIFGLKLANYKGVYDHSGRSAGSQSTYHVDINKYVVALEFFPMNYRLFKNLRINIGGECSCLLYDATEGFHSSWHMPTSREDTNTSSYTVYTAGTWDGNKRISAGIITRVAYEIALSDEWFFIPQILFYVGLTDEFKVGLARTMRPYLEIGLAKKLPQKTR